MPNSNPDSNRHAFYDANSSDAHTHSHASNDTDTFSHASHDTNTFSHGYSDSYRYSLTHRCTYADIHPKLKPDARGAGP